MNHPQIYDYYTQKSRVFCYSVLGMKKGAAFVPEETYMAWKNVYSFDDCRLLLHYKNCNAVNFETYSKNIIEKCTLFEKHVIISETERVYVFDFTRYRTDWQMILAGKYSQLRYPYKKAIEAYYVKDYQNSKIVSKIIYPVKHYSEFAGYLGVTPEIVKEVGEVFDKPDLDREELVVKSEEQFNFF